eukprot:9377469-Prorocentrum_lima.AAC.1
MEGRTERILEPAATQVCVCIASSCAWQRTFGAAGGIQPQIAPRTSGIREVSDILPKRALQAIHAYMSIGEAWVYAQCNRVPPGQRAHEHVLCHADHRSLLVTAAFLDPHMDVDDHSAGEVVPEKNLAVLVLPDLLCLRLPILR